MLFSVCYLQIACRDVICNIILDLEGPGRHWASLQFIFSTTPLREQSICAERVCLSVCLYVCVSVRQHISATTWLNFTKFSVHVACGRGSGIWWYFTSYVLPVVWMTSSASEWSLRRCDAIPKQLRCTHSHRWSACDFLFDFNRNCASISYRFRVTASYLSKRRARANTPAAVLVASCPRRQCRRVIHARGAGVKFAMHHYLVCTVRATLTSTGMILIVS